MDAKIAEAWSGENRPKTGADVRRMLRGLPPIEQQAGEASTAPPTPAIPTGAVSATVEIVKAEPLRTVETVETVVPSKSSGIGSAPKPKKRE